MRCQLLWNSASSPETTRWVTTWKEMWSLTQLATSQKKSCWRLPWRLSDTILMCWRYRLHQQKYLFYQCRSKNLTKIIVKGHCGGVQTRLWTFIRWSCPLRTGVWSPDPSVAGTFWVTIGHAAPRLGGGTLLGECVRVILASGRQWRYCASKRLLTGGNWRNVGHNWQPKLEEKAKSDISVFFKRIIILEQTIIIDFHWVDSKLLSFKKLCNLFLYFRSDWMEKV